MSIPSCGTQKKTDNPIPSFCSSWFSSAAWTPLSHRLSLLLDLPTTKKSLVVLVYGRFGRYVADVCGRLLVFCVRCFAHLRSFCQLR